MGRDLSRSRSPPHYRRRRKSRRGRSRSPYKRQKVQSISPYRHGNRSRTPRHHRSPSASPVPHRRRRSNNILLSPVCKSPSPSLNSIENKSVSEKLKLEEEKQRHQQEAELKLIEEETTRRVEEAIRRKVADSLDSDEIKREIQMCLEEGRKKLNEEVVAELETEKQTALLEAQRKEEQARKEKEELEKMLEENRQRLEEAQRLEALEQQQREEERYRELEELQRQKEEAMRRKKQEEEEERVKQMILLGKNKSRPKLSFALNFK